MMPGAIIPPKNAALISELKSKLENANNSGGRINGKPVQRLISRETELQSNVIRTIQDNAVFKPARTSLESKAKNFIYALPNKLRNLLPKKNSLSGEDRFQEAKARERSSSSHSFSSRLRNLFPGKTNSLSRGEEMQSASVDKKKVISPRQQETRNINFTNICNELKARVDRANTEGLFRTGASIKDVYKVEKQVDNKKLSFEKTDSRILTTLIKKELSQFKLSLNGFESEPKPESLKNLIVLKKELSGLEPDKKARLTEIMNTLAYCYQKADNEETSTFNKTSIVGSGIVVQLFSKEVPTNFAETAHLTNVGSTITHQILGQWKEITV